MRVRSVAVALGCILALGAFVFGVSTASGEPAQFPTETTAPPFPAPPTTGILVPGETTTVVPTTAPSAPTSPRPEPQSQEDNQDSDAGRTVWMAIIGLVVVAVLILVLTVLYARHTRPSRRRTWDDDGPLDEDDEPFSPTAARSVFGDSGHDEQTFWWAED
jgi:hypothetical protein